MTKVPCGGFYVGDGLSVNEDGVLSAGGSGVTFINVTELPMDSPVNCVDYIKNGKMVVLMYNNQLVYPYDIDEPMADFYNLGRTLNLIYNASTNTISGGDS